MGWLDFKMHGPFKNAPSWIHPEIKNISMPFINKPHPQGLRLPCPLSLFRLPGLLVDRSGQVAEQTINALKDSSHTSGMALRGLRDMIFFPR